MVIFCTSGHISDVSTKDQFSRPAFELALAQYATTHMGKHSYFHSLHFMRILVIVSEWESDVHKESCDCSNTECDVYN